MKGLDVLVVEDHDDSRETLLTILAAFGATVRGARDGVEALQAAARQKPDLIFCDLVMPGIDGFELVKRIRGDPALRGVRVIAITGWMRDDAASVRSGAAGFDGHLVKPIDMEALRTQLAQLFGPPPG